MTKEELDKLIESEAYSYLGQEDWPSPSRIDCYIKGSLSPSRREADIRRAVELARADVFREVEGIPCEDWYSANEIVAQMLKEEE